MSELSEDIESMHKMDDKALVGLFNEVSIIAYRDQVNAEFARYEQDKILLAATEDEILQRMKRRNQYTPLLAQI